MPFRKKMKGMSSAFVQEGFWDMDEETNPFQRAATARLGSTIQMEQEAFLSQNPQIKTLLETFYSNMVSAADRTKEWPKDAAAQILKLGDQIADDTCPQPDSLELGPGPCCKDSNDTKSVFTYKDEYLEEDFKKIYFEHYPPPPRKDPTPVLPTPNTLSSSFISIITSETTLPTPEPIPTPEPTLSELMMQMVSNTVDKAIYSLVNEQALLYDTAYMELAKAVENAMEIPVIDIRVDIAELLFCSYRMFEMNIMDKERIAAEIAWEKRMRKKLKRTLRRMQNFRGYETPPTPKSEVSSHESYKVPPHRPCECHPQYHYNRYPKDRFGIYLPREDEFSTESVTAPLAFAEEEPGLDSEENSTTA